ncbi:MAG: Isoprenylcysteine carboxyl methyltransferase [Rhodocyclaceae bacterium]|nr:Isoprenylcysteine carboxyl methyltransferase [Rhodocyclaceae bacterium]
MAFATMKNQFEQFSRSKAYDLLMRLPILAFNGYFLVREVQALWAYLGEHPAWGPSFGDVLLNTASRLAIIGFIGLLFLFHLLRSRPVLKSRGVVPRVVAVMGVVLVLGWVVLPRAVPDVRYDLAAMLVILLGNLLSVVSVVHLGRSLSVMPEARKLVTSGPYALVRHPLYLAEGISLLGILVAFRSWAALVLVVVNFGFQVARARYEERVLARAFPDYETYRQTTPMLIPKPAKLFSALGASAGFWGLGLATAVLTLGLSWGLAAGVFGDRYFPVVETVFPEATLRVLTKPRASPEACQAVLDRYQGEYSKRCPSCPAGKAECRKSVSTDDEAILLGQAGTRVYLRQDDTRIVIEGRTKGESIGICLSMLKSLTEARAARVVECHASNSDG